MGTTILLVDDHNIFRAGLRSLLQFQDPSAIILEAADGATARQIDQESNPDLIVLDLQLPDQHGMEVARHILARRPEAKVIILSGEPDLSYAGEAYSTGAMAYLLKGSTPEELPRAVKTVLRGELYACPEVVPWILRDYKNALARQGAAPKTALSAQEAQVLQLLAQGTRMKEIADQMAIGIRTVETYRVRLLRKTGCEGTKELIEYAVRHGYVRK